MKEDQRRRKRKAREQNPLMRRGYLEKHVVEYHMRLKVDREGMPRNLHGVPRVFFSPSAAANPSVIYPVSSRFSSRYYLQLNSSVA